VSTGSPWTVDRDCLKRALADWRATEPDAVTRSRVNDWLIDLARDPLTRGREEDRPGVFLGRVHGTNVGVLFNPDTDRLLVCVEMIFDVDDLDQS
jgi:hypothetical protein